MFDEQPDGDIHGECSAEIHRLEAEIAAAIPAMREYARKNPEHLYHETWQDPNGVHAWLYRNDSMTPNA